MNPPQQPKAVAGLYTVRITLDGLKHSIQQALLDHDGNLRATVEAALNHAVESFDVAAEVRLEAGPLIRQAIQDALRQAVREALQDPDIRDYIREQAQQVVRKLFDEGGK